MKSTTITIIGYNVRDIISDGIRRFINLGKFDDAVSYIEDISSKYKHVPLKEVCSHIYTDVRDTYKLVLHAIKSGHSLIIKVFLHNNTVNVNDNAAFLTEAVMTNNLDIVSMLLEHGADVNAEDVHVSIPLDYAIESRNEEMVRFLLKNGAHVNHTNRSSPTVFLSTPLMLATTCISSSTNVTYITKRDLVKRTSEDSPRGGRWKGCFRLAKLLLIENYANVNQGNEAKHTPLMFAVQCLQYKVKIWKLHSS